MQNVGEDLKKPLAICKAMSTTTDTGIGTHVLTTAAGDYPPINPRKTVTQNSHSMPLSTYVAPAAWPVAYILGIWPNHADPPAAKASLFVEAGLRALIESFYMPPWESTLPCTKALSIRII